MHKNTQIRAAIRNILIETGTTINVYDSRIRAIPDTKLPAICIYTNSETAEKTPDELQYTRRVFVDIVLYVIGHDRIHSLQMGELSADEKLDELMEFVESRLFKQYATLEKQVYRFNFQGYQIQSDPEGENGIRLMAVTRWEARWHNALA